VVNDFISHVDSIPSGYKVIAFTAKKHKMATLWPAFYQAMRDLGSNRIQSIKNSHPYILLGEKGGKPEASTEKTADTSLPLEPATQIIGATLTLYPLRQAGSLRSSLIGPAKNWQDVDLRADQKSSDTVFYDMLGIDKAGETTLLKEGLQTGTHQLDDIPADQYPYLKLNAHLQDSTRYTPAHLDHWLVHYGLAAEGSLKPDIAYAFNQGSIQRGDSLRIKIAYQNISLLKMDSLLVSFSVNDEDRTTRINIRQRYRPLSPGETLIIEKKLPTQSLSGKNRFRLSVNPGFDQPETYLFNNIYATTIQVDRDKTAPVLDVTFNGRHIKDGAIVTPKPTIRLTLRDDNPYFPLDDTTLINARLKWPDGNEQRLNYQQHLTFQPAAGTNTASAIYKPADKLPNGTYQLTVQSRDATGNPSGSQAYQKRFKVVNQSAIKDFRPVPNPATEQLRFAFTLSGEQVPDQFRIRILNNQGELVRKLTKAELAPLSIGHNTTGYLGQGDGRFGIPLEPGIYFYHLKASLNGKAINYHKADEHQTIRKGIRGAFIYLH